MRIIAGTLRGMVLNSFDAENIRPTLDRAREGIFSKIQFNIRDAKVLDLFGGTGAISLEFLSRGAYKVITCDNNKKSIDLINQNFKKARLIPNIIMGDYLSTLEKLKDEKFDIIFLDPPFDNNYGVVAIEFILTNNMLTDDGMIIYEHSSNNQYVYPNEFTIFDSKKYGYIAVDYLRYRDD